MNKCIVLLLSAIVLFGCATSKKSKKRNGDVEFDAERSVEVPKWVYEPQSACSKLTYICASAQGSSFSASDLNAKNSLASIFETKIKSKFEVEQHDYSTEESESMMERVRDLVTESVDTVLKGAIIKERHSKDDLYFSLAALDKLKATKLLRREIGQIDDQLDFLYKEGKRSSILRMHMLFDQREILNQKYTILTNAPLASDFSFSKINSLKYSKNKLNRIKVKAVNTVPRTMIKWIEGLFTQLGYKVLKDSDVDYLVKIKFFAKEEYLKVRGFKKFNFSIVSEAKNNAGEKVGGASTEMISTGRNQQDAFLRIKDKLLERFKEDLSKLNLE